MEETKYDAAGALQALDEIGVISLDRIVASGEKVLSVLGNSGFVEPGDICYEFVFRIGPRRMADLASVAADVKRFGFELNRIGN